MKISTRNISRHITRFEKAVRAHEMMGAMHPDDHQEIQYKYDLAKKNLRQFMIESIVQESIAIALDSMEHPKDCGCHYCT